MSDQQQTLGEMLKPHLPKSTRKVERELERLKGIEADARFLVDRLRSYEADGCQCDLSVREWCGHVSPGLARLEMSLAAKEGHADG